MEFFTINSSIPINDFIIPVVILQGIIAAVWYIIKWNFFSKLHSSKHGGFIKDIPVPKGKIPYFGMLSTFMS